MHAGGALTTDESLANRLDTAQHHTTGSLSLSVPSCIRGGIIEHMVCFAKCRCWIFCITALVVSIAATPGRGEEPDAAGESEKTPQPAKYANLDAAGPLRLQLAAIKVEQLQQLLDMLTTPAGSPDFNHDRDEDAVILQKLSAIATLYPPKADVPFENRQVQMRARNALVQNAALNDQSQLQDQLREMRQLSQSVRQYTGRGDAIVGADYWDLVADLIEINAKTETSLQDRQNAAAQRLDRFMAAYPLKARSDRAGPGKQAVQADRENAKLSLAEHMAVESRLARMRLDVERGIDATTCRVYRELQAGLGDANPRLADWSWMAVVCQWLAKPTRVEEIDWDLLPFDHYAVGTNEQGVIVSILPNPPLPVQVDSAPEASEAGE